MFGKALDIAAIPGLVMGAFFGVYLLISGDLPVVNSRFFYPHFGPFLTVGPLLYLVWIWASWWSLSGRSTGDVLPGVCMTLTIVGELLAKLAHRNPNIWEIAILVSLGLPSLLAPDVYVTRRRVLPSLSVGLATFATLFFATNTRASIQDSSIPSIGRDVRDCVASPTLTCFYLHCLSCCGLPSDAKSPVPR
jgi:hypothetical protein